MEKLKELRTQWKLSQSEIAEKIGVARSTYAGYENGSSEPSYEILIKIADLFDVPVDYLLDREESSIERLEKNLARLDPRIQQAYHSLQNMDEEDLAMTLELIKVIESKNKKG